MADVATAAARGALGPPWDPWLAWQAWQQTWAAGLDPTGAGRWLRAQRLRRLLARATADSPLYARRAQGARQLTDFAPIGKAELMAGFDGWATDRRITLAGAQEQLRRGGDVAAAWLGRYLLWTSSGTTGQPGLFVQDAAALAAYDAQDGLRLRGGSAQAPSVPLCGRERPIAYVGAIGARYAGHVSIARWQRLLPAAWAPRFSLHSVLDPLPQLAAQLQALQPSGLVTYPSCAEALAQLQGVGAMQLALREVWLGGEQLSATRRRAIAVGFGCAVHNCYGASECFSIAFECAHGALHLNEDWVILEAVDKAHRPLPAGEFSDLVLLTNLANSVQPLIRYELSDRVRFLPGRCPCGNAFAAIEVQGRADATLHLPARAGGRVCILPLALETAIEEATGLSAFQCLHRRDGVLELRAQVQGGAGRDDEAAPRCAAALREWLRQQGARSPHIVCSPEPPMRCGHGGKLPRVLELAGDAALDLSQRAASARH